MEVERKLGYTYEINDADVEHYQWICPPCRRAMFAIAQGLLSAPAAEDAIEPAPTTYANPGQGQGPLGEEDRDNFHP